MSKHIDLNMNRNIIKAWWWRGEINLGDVLTPYIIKKLSGIECENVGYKWTYVLKYLLGQIHHHLPINKKILTPFYFKEPEYILGVGSILHHESDGKAIAWGSGFLKREHVFTGKKAVAVRGEYSAKRLHELGYPQVNVLGDPALLLPLIFNEQIPKNEKIAIIPHYVEYEEFNDKYGQHYDIINMKTSDIEGTVKKISSYRYILSSSLHGIIIGQAYKVPTIWIEAEQLANDSFHFKFRDYFSSVGIDYYEPYRNIDEIVNGDIKQFFEDNKSRSSINKDLSVIQQNLLKVAPFPVLSQYFK